MDVISRLRTATDEVFAAEPVQFAYLFGSQARGQARDDSDVDVAVRFTEDVPPDRYLALSLTLAGQLAYRAHVGPINGLVVLNEAPLRLIGRVLRDRVILYSQDERARVDFEVHLGKLAMDFEIFAEPLDRALLTTMGRKDG